MLYRNVLKVLRKTKGISSHIIYVIEYISNGSFS